MVRERRRDLETKQTRTTKANQAKSQVSGKDCFGLLRRPRNDSDGKYHLAIHLVFRIFRMQ